MKRKDATTLAILVLGGAIIWQMSKKPAKAAFDPWSYSLDSKGRIALKGLVEATGDYDAGKITQEQMDLIKELYKAQTANRAVTAVEPSIPTSPTGPPAEKPYRPMGYLIPKPARLIPLPISGPLFYLPPGEIPTDYTQRIRKSYYDDLWNRGELRWKQAANTFWGATEKATEYSDIYPAYMEAYDMAVTQ